MKISRAVAGLMIGSGLWIGPAVYCSAQTSGQIDELVRASHIIFLGRVEELRAANLKVVRPTEGSALVRVEEALDVPPSVASLKGERVTLQLAHPGELRVGEAQIFFTNALVFGEHLEVKEVGHIAAPSTTASLRGEILAVREQVAQEKLKSRSDGATLIVAGKVVEVKALEKTGPISEHQPDWAEAILEVSSVEKGDLRERTVIVVFPQSTDERWLLSPKFKTGESGIWLLRHLEFVGLPRDSWFALNALDFQPAEKAEVIHKLTR